MFKGGTSLSLCRVVIQMNEEKNEKKFNVVMFLPIASIVLCGICFCIQRHMPTSYTVTAFTNAFDSFVGLMMFLPMSGIPIGIIGLSKGWNKVLSIINIVIGSLMFLGILFLLMLLIFGLVMLAQMY